MTTSEAAYVAGIVDGEGTINIAEGWCARKRGNSYHPRLSVGSTSKKLVDCLIRVFGGRSTARKVPSNPKAKDQWCWYLNGYEAVTLLLEIRPFLVIKPLQANLVLAVPRFREFTGKRARGRNWTPTELAQGAEAYACMHRLNKRGR